jgi:uncharacterized protein YjbJ (UPF0337 family)
MIFLSPGFIYSLSLREANPWREIGRRMRDWQFRQSGSTHKEFDMDWNIVEGNWKQFKGKVKTQWGKLTDDHLDVIAGKRDQLAGKIQETYGITKDEVEQQIRDFESDNKDKLP